MTSKSMLLSISLAAAAALASGAVSARTEIQNKGSDTLVNVAQSWAEQYGKIDPNVAVAVSGGGSGTGIAALINGTVDIANASRKMSGQGSEAGRPVPASPRRTPTPRAMAAL